MKVNIKRVSTVTLSAVLLLAVAGCSNMSKRDRNTAIGAGVGAVGGAILTDGSALGTVGGAAIGGLIGHQVKNNFRSRHTAGSFILSWLYTGNARDFPSEQHVLTDLPAADIMHDQRISAEQRGFTDHNTDMRTTIIQLPGHNVTSHIIRRVLCDRFGFPFPAEKTIRLGTLR